MTATDIVVSSHYINAGTTCVLWVPTIANISAPTRAELNAGTDLARENSASEGWNIVSEQVPIPNMRSRFTGSIPGRLTADDSKLTMYASIDGVDARTLMPREGEGNIVWMDGGDVAGYLMDIFPVTIASHGKERSVEGSTAAIIDIMYSITEEPAVDIAIPA